RSVRCGNTPGVTPVGPTPGPEPTPAPTTVVMIGAGDIGMCDNDGGAHAENTARIIEANPGALVFAAGDLAYQHGTTAEFNTCYAPRWGRFKNRTRPAPGNHEYEQPGAVPYYTYFGDTAGPFGVGFYSYDYGNWHV